MMRDHDSLRDVRLEDSGQSVRTTVKALIGMQLSGEELASLRSVSASADVLEVEGNEGLLEEIASADLYVPGPWTRDVFQAGKRLRWVHFPWAGLEGVLFPALVESEVVVTNSAGVFAIPMAEHALALMLAFSRAIAFSTRREPRELWHEKDSRQNICRRIGELQGATLGIVGYGGIGQAVAQRAKAFGMRVLALRRHPEKTDQWADAVWGLDRLDEILRQSDYLLISCALTPATRGLVGARELSVMKEDAVIINLARGAIVDQPALIQALREGRIRGAGLDVTTPEPLPLDSPMWQMENVIITPHISGMSPQTRHRQLELLRENLCRYTQGRELLNVVDKQAGY